MTPLWAGPMLKAIRTRLLELLGLWKRRSSAPRPTVTVIYLDEDDTAPSVRARLQQATTESVELVIPRGARQLSNPIHLKALGQELPYLGVKVRLTTRDSQVREAASAVGLALGKEISPARGISPGDASSPGSSSAYQEGWTQRAFSMRGLPALAMGVVALLVAIGLPAAVAMIFLPTATVILPPVTRPVEDTFELTASALASSNDFRSFTIPAYILETEVSTKVTEEVEAAHEEIPSVKAKGNVLFTNINKELAPTPPGVDPGEAPTPTPPGANPGAAPAPPPPGANPGEAPAPGADAGEAPAPPPPGANPGEAPAPPPPGADAGAEPVPTPPVVDIIVEPVTIPAGTSVGTTSDVLFVTEKDVTLPGKKGATASVSVEAVEGGSIGNVPAHTVTRVLDELLAESVSVTNPFSFQEGADKRKRQITAADYQQVRETALEHAQQDAVRRLRQILPPDASFYDPTVRLRIANEEFSAAIGEETADLSLTLHVTGSVVVFSGGDVNAFAAHYVSDQLEHTHLVPDSLQVRVMEPTASDNDRVTFRLQVSGVLQHELNETAVRQLVAGRTVEEAVALLEEQLPPDVQPEITVGPFWVEKIPTFFWRIIVQQQSA